jgi:hypothetical protein
MTFREKFLREWELYALMALAITLRLPDLGLPFFWDEMLVYVKPAYLLVTYGFSQLLHSRVEPLLFFGHEPGFAALLGLTFKLFGVQVEAARGLMLALTAMQLFYTYRIGVWFAGRLAGSAAVLLWFAIPVVYAHSTQALADVAAASFAIAACYQAIRARPKSYMVFGLLAGSMRVTALAVFIPVLLMKIFMPRERPEITARKFFYYSAPLLSIPAYFLLEKFATGSWITTPAAEGFSFQPEKYFANLSAYALDQLWVEQNLRFLTLSALAGALLAFFKLGKGPEVFLFLGITASYLLGVSFFSQANMRYCIPIYSLIAVLAAAIFVRITSYRWLWLLPVLLWVTASARQLHGTDSYVGNGFEDDLQHRDIVKVHQQMADYLQKTFPGKRIYAVWPFSQAIRLPFLGYVENPALLGTVNPSEPFDLLVLTETSAPGDYLKQQETIEKFKLVEIKRFTRSGKSISLWAHR